MKLHRLLISIIAISLMGGSLSMMAQTKTPQEIEQDKALRTSLDAELERLEKLLELDYAQVFYIDSMLTANYDSLYTEFRQLQKTMVSNNDLYVSVQDKWMTKIYYAFETLLNDDQWAKYKKSGAERAQKSRDKRAQTSEKKKKK